MASTMIIHELNHKCSDKNTCDHAENIIIPILTMGPMKPIIRENIRIPILTMASIIHNCSDKKTCDALNDNNSYPKYGSYEAHHKREHNNSYHNYGFYHS